MPFKAHIFDVQDLPLYQKIAPKVNELVQLDLKKKQVARALGISEKVVDRSLQWIKITGTEYPILPQKERLELLRNQFQTLSNLRPYQRMGEEAYTLHQKGVTKLDIAKKFGVDWDTAHRAILWWEKMLKQLE